MVMDEWIVLPEGEEWIVHTDDLCAWSGGCERCPGFGLAKHFNLADVDPEMPVFCIHGCHRAVQ